MIKNRFSHLESLKIMGRASEQQLGPDIQVLLWNMFKCKRKSWQEDFLTLTRDKHLVILQEAIFKSPFDVLFSQSTRYQWIMASSFKNLRTKVENGIKTGSTVAAKKHFFSASAHSEPITKTKKMLLVTEYPLHHIKTSETESSLLVVNTHVINFVHFEKFKTHLNQIFQALEQHQGPIILAGDFNTWSEKRLNYFDQLATSFALQAVQIIRQPRLHHLFKHLDHIYCRGLLVVDAKVHTDIHSSDHYPISLSVRTVDV